MNRKLLVTFVCVGLALAAFTGQLDSLGKETAEKAFQRALVTFAAARTLNGVISVAQGTEVAIEPAGVGVNFSVGQILDPVNDLIERFSSVMLVATSALGLQNILLSISKWWGISALLLASLTLLVVTVWSPKATQWNAAALRIVLVTVAIRFALPLMVIGTNFVFDTFLEQQHSAATQALEATRVDISKISEQSQPPKPIPDQTLRDKIGAFLDESIDRVNVTDKIEQLRERLSNASEHIINLIVIFVLQTVVIPILFLYLMVNALKAVGARAFSVN